MSWDERFLDLARTVAAWSRDPSTQVGAVIVRPDRTVASLGYNGFPRGCDDDPELYANREEKYGRIVHAEINAVLHSREHLAGYTLYCTHPCCDRCTAQILQTGISRIVFAAPEPGFLARWGSTFDRASAMCREAGVIFEAA